MPKYQNPCQEPRLSGQTARRVRQERWAALHFIIVVSLLSLHFLVRRKKKISPEHKSRPGTGAEGSGRNARGKKLTKIRRTGKVMRGPSWLHSPHLLESAYFNGRLLLTDPTPQKPFISKRSVSAGNMRTDPFLTVFRMFEEHSKCQHEDG